MDVGRSDRRRRDRIFILPRASGSPLEAIRILVQGASPHRHLDAARGPGRDPRSRRRARLPCDADLGDGGRVRARHRQRGTDRRAVLERSRVRCWARTTHLPMRRRRSSPTTTRAATRWTGERRGVPAARDDGLWCPLCGSMRGVAALTRSRGRGAQQQPVVARHAAGAGLGDGRIGRRRRAARAVDRADPGVGQPGCVRARLRRAAQPARRRRPRAVAGRFQGRLATLERGRIGLVAGGDGVDEPSAVEVVAAVPPLQTWTGAPKNSTPGSSAAGHGWLVAVCAARRRPRLAACPGGRHG